MHPEIQRPGPGSCPICGMALEPMTPMIGDGPSAEYADMKRRFAIGIPLVIRITTGAGRQLAAQHSHSLEGWFAHVPGLRVVAPATVADGKVVRACECQAAIVAQMQAVMRGKGGAASGKNAQ